ncbi:Na+-driven multidrug efflux pump [Tangfeifania diversioriginum]|uniref:Na+-driven multidrug efflux pump n=1 Tax=Tangfeifania diversioriginum TaxID=1168035 RepID=A0A1M6NP00_9BACT|nr:MATE family efflux transporter [Tangfeifania diversioriginum]SHJ97423.1 Na+-driven multidrug efflux pump [Tangfeifania diversioriginum]
MKTSDRVIFNTIVLYGKLIVVLIIGLISTRLVLSALGETDYGIYSLVAGVVGMLAFLQSTLSSASMRFLAYNLGKNDEHYLKRTFNTTLFLHLFLGVILVIIMEVGGYFMFEYFLNIPLDRISAAKVLFHFMVLSTFVTVVLVPYDAVMNSHEDLFMLSVFDLIGNFIHLGAAIYLTIANTRLLITYGFFMFISQLVQRGIKMFYSNKKYKECVLNFKYIDKLQIRSILSFSSWRLVGSVASVIASQVRGVIINVFFGVKLNAANGIALQVSNQINNLSTSLTRAIRPQIIKSEGQSDRERMLRITSLATKYSVLLFSLFAIPIFFEMEFLLNLWLKEAPDYTLIFSRLIIIGLFVSKLTFEIGTAISAVGRIKEVTLVESAIMVSAVVLSYYFYTLNFPPYTIYAVSIIFGFFTFVANLYYGKKIAGLNILEYLKSSLLPLVYPISISLAFVTFIYYSLDMGFLRLSLNTIGAVILFLISFRLFSINQWEIQKFNSLIQVIKMKIRTFIK